MTQATINFPASYIEKLAACLKAHSINLGKPHSVKAAQHYLDQVSGELGTALENYRAGQSNYHPAEGVDRLTVSWCEANMKFAVEVDGQAVEHFPTRKEAEAHAKELAKGMVHEEEAAAASCH